MLVHSDPLFTIYFGDEREKFDHHAAREQHSLALFNEHPFKKLIPFLGLRTLVLLQQIHGSSGLILRSYEQAAGIVPFMCEGDFIITNVPAVGLGVVTADCIPLVIFDKTKNVVAMVHAGWRGSVAEVALKALKKMEEEFQVNRNTIRIFMGPSAKGCCYTVGDAVIKELERFPFYEKVLYATSGKVYADFPLFNALLLEDYGVKKEAFHCTYNVCTLCNPTFCSYRREGAEKKWRQVNIVTLK